jgi:hypothetical protein
VREFQTFSEPLAELIVARIWAGLHYRSADVEGQRLGRNVANYGAAHYFQPVGRGCPVDGIKRIKIHRRTASITNHAK